MKQTILSENQHSTQLPIEDMNRIINLDRYPLHRLDDADGQQLVMRCQQDLDAKAASALHDFIRPEAIKRMSAEATGLIEGDNDGWHYDPNDGVVTLLLQTPDSGGEFEYAPNIRTEDNENYAGCKKLFDDPQVFGQRVEQRAGTFTFFNGRHSMHRVREVGATCKPRIVGIFSFDQNPDQVFGQNYINMVHDLPQGAPD